MRTQLRDDRGVATAWAVALVQLLIVVTVVIAGYASVVVARMKASTVADLAALAAVQQLQCAAADAVAASNGMSITRCVNDGADVVVEVTAPAPPMVIRMTAWLGQRAPTIAVSARAGLS